MDIPVIPVAQLYKHMIDQGEPILPSEINRDTEEEPSLTWKLLTHPVTYIGTIGMVFIACMGVYCLKRFWCRHAIPKMSTLLPSLIMTCYCKCWCRDTPIDRGGGMVEKPIRPHENHDLQIECETTRPESHCKQPALSKAVPSARLLAFIPKSKEQNYNE